MKKILLGMLSIGFLTAVNAQQIDINDVFMTASGVSDPSQKLDHDSLEAGSTVTLWFHYTNNLDSTLAVDDNITFGWSIDGNNQNTLVQASRNNPVNVGASVNAYLQQTYTLPDSGSFEICVWPLHNPYSPNTDPNVGNSCKTFTIFTEDNGNGNGGTTGIANLNVDNTRVYAGRDEVVIETGEITGVTNITVFDLTGKTVYNRKVQLNSNSIERVNASNLKTGMYIVRLSRNNTVLKTEKVILR